MRDLAQEQALLERMQQGDMQACEELLVLMLPCFRRIAAYYFQLARAQSRDHRLEVDDMVQEACLAVCERLEAAFTQPNPAAYLLATGKWAIRRYCHTHRNSVTIPDGSDASWLTVESLETSPSLDEPTVTLAETLAAPSGRTPKPKLHPFLYLALNVLTPAQRLVIEQHYGLMQTENKSTSVLRHELGISREAVNVRKNKGLARLREVLAPVYGYQEEPAHPSGRMPQLVSAS